MVVVRHTNTLVEVVELNRRDNSEHLTFSATFPSLRKAGEFVVDIEGVINRVGPARLRDIETDIIGSLYGWDGTIVEDGLGLSFTV